jgi:putative nucleotidyltransferase with HDIG domain
VLTSTVRSPTPSPRVGTSLADVVGALSHALDLTEGAPPGHAVRTCVIGLRLADDLGLDAATRAALAYALLLKDAGCSSNAARMSSLFGSDDRIVKARMKVVDWHRPVRLAVATARNAGRGRPLAERLRYFLGIARAEGVTRELIAIRCDRGSAIARELGFSASTAGAIRALDEHWDGGGYPDGLRGAAIPLLARIANVAQTVEAFHHAHGSDAAIRVVRQRRGSWFDPTLADHVARWRRDRAWWSALTTATAADAAALASAPSTTAISSDPTEDALDGVAEAFAKIVDAKSPYTFRHSANVATYAEAIARELGWGAEARRTMRRAGLLHDIGKLGVSNQILDKPGALTPEERTAVEAHPLHTWEILSRVRAFLPFARMAALHHERLDGLGYPWRVGGEQLDGPARVLAVADIYEALTADRPYRAGMAPAQALAIMAVDRDTKLCGRALDALEAMVSAGQGVAEAA